LEGIEDQVQFVLLDTNTGVGDGKFKGIFVGGALLTIGFADRELNLTVVSELDGITD
jgi:hypothetical protein